MVETGFIQRVRDYSNTTDLLTFTPIAISQSKIAERRSGTYAVIGADVGIDPYGLNAAPVVIPQQTYKFRMFFGAGRPYASFDAAHDALARIVGPGLPHTLVYQDDSGGAWQRQARPLALKHTVTVESYFYADFEITWELRGASWRSFVTAAQKVWGGAGLVWGAATGTWGLSTTALTATSNNINCDLTLATAPETGPIFTIYGPFGTTTPPGFFVQNSSVIIQSPSGPIAMYFQINDTLATAGDQYVIDCGAMSVTKNGVPAYQYFYAPPWQAQWLRLDPGIVNNVTVNDLSGTGQTTGGRARVDFFIQKY